MKSEGKERMKELYMKQKMMSLNGKFTVKDADGEDVYRVSGSFMKVPKIYSIEDVLGREVAVITKKLFSFLPTFFVDVVGQPEVTIQKEFTFLKARYTIHAEGIEVQGNWWDLNFNVLNMGKL